MEVGVNPVPPPSPPPPPPIPFRLNASKTPTIPVTKTNDKMPTTTKTTTETKKPDDTTARMMETFEKRMQAMQDQMAERERHHAKQLEDLTRQLKTKTSHGETHRQVKKSRKPTTVEEDPHDDDTEVRQPREPDARRTREETSNAIARFRAIILKQTHAEHHLTNTEELTTSGLTPVRLQTDLAYNPIMETHTDVVAKCREREKTFKQRVVEDLLSHLGLGKWKIRLRPSPTPRIRSHAVKPSRTPSERTPRWRANSGRSEQGRCGP